MNPGWYDLMKKSGGGSVAYTGVTPYHVRWLRDPASVNWVPTVTITQDTEGLHVPDIRDPDTPVFEIPAPPIIPGTVQSFVLVNHQGTTPYDLVYGSTGLLIWHFQKTPTGIYKFWDLESAAGKVPNPETGLDPLEADPDYLGSPADFYGDPLEPMFACGTNPNTNAYSSITYSSAQSAQTPIAFENIHRDPATGDMVVDVFVTPKQKVILPNGAENIANGYPYTVQWGVRPNACITNVDLEVSTDGGSTFAGIAAAVPNAGQYAWAPTVRGNEYRIRITSHHQAGWTGVDVSDANFSVVDSPPAGAPLNFTGSTTSSITVQWVAPGEDGSVGTATAYDLRYSLTPIYQSNFSSCQQVWTPSPQPAGAQEQRVISGLSDCTIYYWGLKTRDQAGTWSILTNGAATTECSGGGCGDGWCGESARPVVATAVQKQVLRLTPQEAGLAGIALSHVGASAVRLDSLRLVGVARGSDSLAIVSGGTIAIGARRAAEGVEGRSGDVTAILRDSGYVTASGETLTVHFAASGSESLGAALSVETVVAEGASRSLRVLVPNRRGGWFAIAARTLETERGALVVEHVYSDLVCLVFFGECRVTQIDQVRPSRAPMLLPLNLASVRHSRLGDLTRSDGEWGSVLLEPGDGLDLWFQVPDAAASMEDVFLLYNTSATTAPPSEMRAAPRTVLPTAYSLEQNTPNPFGQAAVIRFALPIRSKVTLEVFDVGGRHVRTMDEGELDAGFHHVHWDGRDDTGRQLSPGVYVYRLTAGSFQASKRLIFMP